MANKLRIEESREEAIPRILNTLEAKEAVEVGVFKAQFSKHLLENWQGTLWMVDPWRAF